MSGPFATNPGGIVPDVGLLPADILPREPHPSTGEPFTRCVRYDRRTEQQVVHTLPPGYPLRTVREPSEAWCEDSYYDEDLERWYRNRPRTRVEWEAALAAYAKAKAEWDRTDGATYIAGPTTVTATFATEAGATATGVLTPNGGWYWTETMGFP